MLQTVATENCAAWVKQNTRGKHEAAEAVMMPLIRQANNPEAYGALLRRMYGFYKPMERVLAPFLQGWDINPDLHRKAHLIVQDLDTLGQSSDAPLCAQLPEVKSPMQALGAWYVLEGASLGGRVIARMIRASSTIPEQAFSFFDDQNTGPRWLRFQELMNRLAATPEEMAQVTESADATFAAHTFWMQTH